MTVTEKSLQDLRFVPHQGIMFAMGTHVDFTQKVWMFFNPYRS